MATAACVAAVAVGVAAVPAAGATSVAAGVAAVTVGAAVLAATVASVAAVAAAAASGTHVRRSGRRPLVLDGWLTAAAWYLNKRIKQYQYCSRKKVCMHPGLVGHGSATAAGVMPGCCL